MNKIDLHCCFVVFFHVCQLLEPVWSDLDELLLCKILNTCTLLNIPKAGNYYRLHLTRSELSFVKLVKSFPKFSNGRKWYRNFLEMFLENPKIVNFSRGSANHSTENCPPILVIFHSLRDAYGGNGWRITAGNSSENTRKVTKIAKLFHISFSAHLRIYLFINLLLIWLLYLDHAIAWLYQVFYACTEYLKFDW